MSRAETHELARRIIEFERNLAYRRVRFEDIAKPIEQVVPAKAREDLALAAEIARVRSKGQEEFLGFDKRAAREVQEFFEWIAVKQIRTATRDVAHELKNSDRYLRRAANQLIKQLKGSGGE